MKAKDFALALLNDDELSRLEAMTIALKGQPTKAVYDQYKDIINPLLSIDRYEDYLDYFENREPCDSVLICQYLCHIGVCLPVGGFEDDLLARLMTFVDLKTDTDLRGIEVFEHYRQTTGRDEAFVFTNYAGEDNFFGFLNFFEEHYLKKGLQFIVFFNDVYCQCAYYVGLVDRSFAEDLKALWKDKDVLIGYLG